MKINYQILSIALALCLGFLIINKNSSVNTEEAVMQTIFNRKSVRSFSDKKVADEDLTKLVKAGMAAPTAGNMQPWEFLVINDKSIVEKYANVNQFAKMALEAPAAIVVLANLDTYKSRPEMMGYWPQDTSAATQNILLAVEAMGLGAVWTGVYNGGFSNIRVDGVRDMFNLPQNLVPLNVIIIGHPKGEQTPKDKWKPEKMHWNKI